MASVSDRRDSSVRLELISLRRSRVRKARHHLQDESPAWTLDAFLRTDYRPLSEVIHLTVCRTRESLYSSSAFLGWAEFLKGKYAVLILQNGIKFNVLNAPSYVHDFVLWNFSGFDMARELLLTSCIFRTNHRLWSIHKRKQENSLTWGFTLFATSRCLQNIRFILRYSQAIKPTYYLQLLC